MEPSGSEQFAPLFVYVSTMQYKVVYKLYIFAIQITLYKKIL